MTPPLEGLVMGTRSGDIDPGLVLHLNRVAHLSVDEIDTLLNHRSGLRGLCGENDFRSIAELVDAGDENARRAYDVYIHRLRHYLGAYTFALERLDAITFTAGVGENSARVRADALDGLQRFGIVVDPDRNTAADRSARRISADDSAIDVLVVPTNEELAIARQSAALVAALPPGSSHRPRRRIAGRVSRSEQRVRPHVVRQIDEHEPVLAVVAGLTCELAEGSLGAGADSVLGEGGEAQECRGLGVGVLGVGIVVNPARAVPSTISSIRDLRGSESGICSSRRAASTICSRVTSEVGRPCTRAMIAVARAVLKCLLVAGTSSRGTDRTVVVAGRDGEAGQAEGGGDDAVVGQPQIVVVMLRDVVEPGDLLGRLRRPVLIGEPPADQFGGSGHRELRCHLAGHRPPQYLVEPFVGQFGFVVHQRADAHVPLHPPRITVVLTDIAEQRESGVDVVEL